MTQTSCLLEALNTHTTPADRAIVLKICHAAVLDAQTESALQDPPLPDIQQAAESRVLARMAKSIKDAIGVEPLGAGTKPQPIRRNVPPPEPKTT